MALPSPGAAFVFPSAGSQVRQLRPTSSSALMRNLHQHQPMPITSTSSSNFKSTPSTSSTSLQMGFNLPPPKPKSDVESILTTVGIIGAITLFFMSPLGGIFFAITNSILLLLILIPFVASIGFTVWQSLYTIEAPCPSCNAPARVLKDEEAGPNICLSCGTLLRANVDKDGIELCNNPNDIYDEDSRISSFFDLFTTGGSDGGGVFGSSSSDGDPTAFFGENPRPTDSDDRKKKEKRERTIIDVDVTED